MTREEQQSKLCLGNEEVSAMLLPKNNENISILFSQEKVETRWKTG